MKQMNPKAGNPTGTSWELLSHGEKQLRVGEEALPGDNEYCF